MFLEPKQQRRRIYQLVTVDELFATFYFTIMNNKKMSCMNNKQTAINAILLPSTIQKELHDYTNKVALLAVLIMQPLPLSLFLSVQNIHTYVRLCVNQIHQINNFLFIKCDFNIFNITAQTKKKENIIRLVYSLDYHLSCFLRNITRKTQMMV